MCTRTSCLTCRTPRHRRGTICSDNRRRLEGPLEQTAVKTAVKSAKARLQPSGDLARILNLSQQKTPPDRRGFPLVAHTGFEPVISALRGRRPGPLDECARSSRMLSRPRRIFYAIRRSAVKSRRAFHRLADRRNPNCHERLRLAGSNVGSASCARSLGAGADVSISSRQVSICASSLTISAARMAPSRT